MNKSPPIVRIVFTSSRLYRGWQFPVYRRSNSAISKTLMSTPIQWCDQREPHSYPQYFPTPVLRIPRYRREARDTDSPTALACKQNRSSVSHRIPQHQTLEQNTGRVCPYIDVPDCDTTHICKFLLFFVKRFCRRKEITREAGVGVVEIGRRLQIQDSRETGAEFAGLGD